MRWSIQLLDKTAAFGSGKITLAEEEQEESLSSPLCNNVGSDIFKSKMFFTDLVQRSSASGPRYDLDRTLSAGRYKD